MDPNATYDAMWAAIFAYDWPAAGVHADSLRVWLAGGGFEPSRPHARAWIARICEITAS